MRIRIARAAQDDLESQWLYLAENASLESAEHFEARVTHVLELLTEQPRMGVARDDLLAGLRSFPLNAQCVLFYQLGQDAGEELLEVIRVACNGRNIDNLF